MPAPATVMPVDESMVHVPASRIEVVTPTKAANDPPVKRTWSVRKAYSSRTIFNRVAHIRQRRSKGTRIKWGRRIGTFCRNAMTVSIDDISSLLDTLLLLDTLMLATLIALLTQTSLSKEDIMENDAFNFRMVMVENGLFETTIPVNSHYILFFGQLALGCLFLSIAFAITAYLNLNLSRAREDDEIRVRFAQYFMPFILVAYAFFVGGLVVFFFMLQAIVEVVFPAYCVATLNVPWTTESVHAVFRGTAMHEFTPEEYEACVGNSLLVTYRYTCATVVWVAFPSILIAGFVLNAWVDCTHSSIEGDGGAGDASEEDVGELLVSIDPRFSKYLLRFNAADITIDQLPFLEKRDYLHIGVTLGDAIRMIGYFQNGGVATVPLREPLEASDAVAAASGAVVAAVGSAAGAVAAGMGAMTSAATGSAAGVAAVGMGAMASAGTEVARARGAAGRKTPSPPPSTGSLSESPSLSKCVPASGERVRPFIDDGGNGNGHE